MVCPLSSPSIGVCCSGLWFPVSRCQLSIRSNAETLLFTSQTVQEYYRGKSQALESSMTAASDTPDGETNEAERGNLSKLRASQLDVAGKQGDQPLAMLVGGVSETGESN